MSSENSFWLPLVVATLLAGQGWKKKSLSQSGALTAFVIGYLFLAGGTYAFGVTLIAFYLVGSKATKYGKKQKAQLEDHYHEAGYRTGWQVLSNSAAALIAAFAWNAIFVPSSLQATLSAVLGLDFSELLRTPATSAYDRGSSGWCPLDVTIADGWSRLLVFAVVGHFACCLGDTLASELGILSQSPPVLVTTFKRVPPGTNGAMSVGGTIASIFGGGFIGLIAGLSFVLENVKCAESASAELLSSVFWGMLGGGFGSLLDSLLGATIQQSRYSESKKRIVEEAAGSDTKAISGLDILTNNQVNVVSSFVSAGVIGWAAAIGWAWV
ncbi:integral membrane protein DUF92-domain-containing protein [Coprinopsis sp. MPI-PUGE-AT-0042]|nr:integral membrane protein DUF92-domain-containing protein [Coprinopsis sp. MPI-PUGE-AT-0042]